MNIQALAMGLTFSVGAISTFTDGQPSMSAAPRPETIVYNDADVDCLARNIYFEARGEDSDGMRAVGLVTINRVRSDNHPDTVCDVVHESQNDSNGHPLRNRCQFSWYCDGRSDRVRDTDSFKVSYEIAKEVLSGDVEDITSGAVNYHADYVSPRWRNDFVETTRVGRHIFYRPYTL